MLEAPEALLLARQMTDTLTGKKIETVLAGFTPHKFTFFNPAPGELEPMLNGRTVTGAVAVGGMVRLDTDGVSVAFSDGVNFRYIEPPADLPRTHQLLIGFTDQTCLTVSVRMYAGIICFAGERPAGRLADYYISSLEKPYVLSDGFTLTRFLSTAEDPAVAKKTVKALLATEQRIPGLGNGVLQDILFTAGLNPRTRVSALTAGHLEKLYRAVKHTLQSMYSQNGRDSETDLFGRRGGYRARMSKDTAGKPCVVCGTVIVKENYMGGSVYYCPVCQPVQPVGR